MHSHTNSILSGIKPLIKLCEICTCELIRISNNKFHILKFSFNKVILITLYLLTIAIAMVFNNYYESREKVQFINTVIQDFGKLLICIVTTIVLFTKRILLKNIFNYLVELHVELKKAGSNITYSKIKNIILIQLIYIGMQLIAKVILSTSKKNVLSMLTNIIIQIPHSINTLVIYQQMAVLLVMSDLFKEMNKLLLYQVIKKNGRKCKSIRYPLKIFKKIHFELTETGKLFNEVFGLPLLLNIGYLFITITVNLYRIYKAQAISLVSETLAICLFGIIELCLIVLPCSALIFKVIFHFIFNFLNSS